MGYFQAFENLQKHADALENGFTSKVSGHLPMGELIKTIRSLQKDKQVMEFIKSQREAVLHPYNKIIKQ